MKRDPEVRNWSEPGFRAFAISDQSRETGDSMFQYCLESVMEIPGNRFERCLAAILRDNNGYASGGLIGPTNHGISQAAYSLWRQQHSLPDKEVWQITFEEVQAFYQREFWVPSHAAACPPPLDMLVFKCAIESGPRWALQTLQQALELPRNGRFCQRTRAMVKSQNGRESSLRFLDVRMGFYRDLWEKDPSHRTVFTIKLAQLDRLRPTLCPHVQETAPPA